MLPNGEFQHIHIQFSHREYGGNKKPRNAACETFDQLWASMDGRLATGGLDRRPDDFALAQRAPAPLT
jgi:hypothetical protein